MKIKISALILACAAASLTGCYEDKGNYTYSEVEDITVTFPEGMEAMQGSPITFTPVVTSSIKGVIKPDDPDYEYSCRIQYSHYDDDRNYQTWLDIDPEGTQAINYSRSLPAQDFLVWYKVRNKTTELERSFQARYNIKSASTEGWMVLSRNADDRARIDMAYQFEGKDYVYADIILDDAVKMYKPRQLVFFPQNNSAGDVIFLICDGPGYKLDTNSLHVVESTNMQSYFISQSVADDMICYAGIYDYGFFPDYQLCITPQGNVHTIMQVNFGGAFEYPINTDAPGNEPLYKVAPDIGRSSADSDLSVFYDITNKKFKGFTYTTNASEKILFDIPEPAENRLFSYTTGLDFVKFTHSAFSGGEVYAVLQEPGGHRVLYVIGVTGYERSDYTQNGYYPNITAPDFDTATDYAASSQYSYMFYCKDNKVYSYNYVSGAVADQLTLPAGETASVVKFNRYMRLLMYVPIQRVPNDEVYRSMENKLIVGSSDGTENGGVIRFYDISPQGKLTLFKEIKGFGHEIVDVVYREQRH